MQDNLRQAIQSNTLELPSEFVDKAEQIASLLEGLVGQLEIKNADERQQIRPRQAILDSAEFRALWDQIKHKTTYRVEFNSEDLVQKCIKALCDAPDLQRARIQWRKADLKIASSGVAATERKGATTVVLNEVLSIAGYSYISSNGILTRYIVCLGRRLDDFKRNTEFYEGGGGDFGCKGMWRLDTGLGNEILAIKERSLGYKSCWM